MLDLALSQHPLLQVRVAQGRGCISDFLQLIQHLLLHVSNQRIVQGKQSSSSEVCNVVNQNNSSHGPFPPHPHLALTPHVNSLQAATAVAAHDGESSLNSSQGSFSLTFASPASVLAGLTSGGTTTPSGHTGDGSATASVASAGLGASGGSGPGTGEHGVTGSEGQGQAQVGSGVRGVGFIKGSG